MDFHFKRLQNDQPFRVGYNVREDSLLSLYFKGGGLLSVPSFKGRTVFSSFFFKGVKLSFLSPFKWRTVSFPLLSPSSFKGMAEFYPLFLRVGDCLLYRLLKERLSSLLSFKEGKVFFTVY